MKNNNLRFLVLVTGLIFTYCSINAQNKTLTAAPNQEFTYNNGNWTEQSNETSSPFDNSSKDNLIISSGDSLRLTGDIEENNITIEEGAVLETKNIINIDGDIVNNGKLRFLSTAQQDGELGTMAATSDISGSGKETVQRYISPRRVYRLISSPVTTTTSINENWQEGVHNTSTDYGDQAQDPNENSNKNPHPGFGTHITGSTTGANGFDATETGNSSLYTLTSTGYDPIGNTDRNTIDAGQAYALVVRGSRSVNLGLDNYTQTTNSNGTTLRTTGRLFVGDTTFTSAANDNEIYLLIGNPYQASVGIKDILESSNNINTNYYYLYDSTLGTEGSYITVDLSDESASTNNNNLDTDKAYKYLQPSQAFMVKTTGGNNAPEITFTEEDKATDNHISVLNEGSQGNTPAKISGKLYTAENYTDQEGPQAGFSIIFDENFSNDIQANDADMAANFAENFGRKEGSHYLSIERRATPTADDHLDLYINQYSHENYTLVFDVGDITDGITPYLKDKLTGESYELDSGENTVSYAVDPEDESNTESKAFDRFYLYFKNTPLNNDEINSNSLAIYPNPTQSGQPVYINAAQYSGTKANIRINDINGREVYQSVKTLKSKTVLNPENLSTGIYMLTVKGQAFEKTQKLIIE